jgi:hypothetical protein
MKLYEMTRAYDELFSAAVDGDWDEASMVAFDGMLNGLEDDIEQKLLGIARVVKNLSAEEKALKDEIDRLAAKRNAITNSLDRLKAYAQTGMVALGLDKVSDSVFTVAMQANPPSVEVFDEDLIPGDYWVPVEPRLDKTRVKEAIKAGQDVPGAQLVQTKGIRFR